MKRKKNEGPTTKDKGDVLERIVAMMHEASDAKVLRDVHLPAKNDASRSRQIDVLLVGRMAGYQSVLAIDCKNYKRNINVTDIGEFKDLLEDVGLSPQQGILVSTSQIGAGALSRAEELGMRVYELRGLTPARLSEAVHDASQMVVFVVAAMSELSVVNAVDAAAYPHELLMLFDESGEVAGYIHDLLWLRWLEGEPPSVLGKHEVEIKVPQGWHMIVAGRREPVLSASAKVKVHAAVVEYAGTSSRLTLVDPKDGGVQRFHASASFDTFGEHPVSVFEEESELETFVQDRGAALNVTVARIRTPRIQVNHVYWPLSERLLRRARQYQKFYDRGRIGMPNPEDFAGVEGTDLNVLWEPIAEDQTALDLLKRRENGRLGS